MNEGINKNEEPEFKNDPETNGVWSTDPNKITKKEILKLKEKIGKDFENLKFKYSTYSSEVNTDRVLKGIALENEANLTMEAYGIKKLAERLIDLKKTIKEVKRTDQELYLLKKSKPENEEKIIEKERQLRELQTKMKILMNEKTIEEDSVQDN